MHSNNDRDQRCQNWGLYPPPPFSVVVKIWQEKGWGERFKGKRELQMTPETAELEILKGALEM